MKWKRRTGVQDVFYQVFDKGEMRDGEGRDINFRNTIIVMTTNAGTETIMSLCADPETIPGPDAFATAVFPELQKTFKSAFLGRVAVVPFYPLSDDVLAKIIVLKLGKICKRIRDQYGATFEYSTDLISTIAARCTEVDTGARNVDHILRKTLLPELSREFLVPVGCRRCHQPRAHRCRSGRPVPIQPLLKHPVGRTRFRRFLREPVRFHATTWDWPR